MIALKKVGDRYTHQSPLTDLIVFSIFLSNYKKYTCSYITEQEITSVYIKLLTEVRTYSTDLLLAASSPQSQMLNTGLFKTEKKGRV